MSGVSFRGTVPCGQSSDPGLWRHCHFIITRVSLGADVGPGEKDQRFSGNDHVATPTRENGRCISLVRYKGRGNPRNWTTVIYPRILSPRSHFFIFLLIPFLWRSPSKLFDLKLMCRILSPRQKSKTNHIKVLIIHNHRASQLFSWPFFFFKFGM